MTSHPPAIPGIERVAPAIFAAALLAMAAATLLYSARIPAQTLPMQWGPGGAPGFFGPRAVSLWAVVAALAVAGVALIVSARLTDTSKRPVWRMLIIASAVAVAAQGFHLWALLRWAGA